MVDRDLHGRLSLAAVARLESGDAEVDLPVEVRVVDCWRSGEHDAVLFWAARDFQRR